MTTLAEASVDIVAETESFPEDLRRQLQDAGATADRASRTLGRRIGRGITDGAADAIAGIGTAINRPLRRLEATFSTLGQRLGRALAPSSGSLRALTTGLRNLGQQATGLARRGLDSISERVTAIGRSLVRTNTSLVRFGSVIARAAAVGTAALSGLATVFTTLPAVASLAATSAAGAFAVGIAGIGIAAAAVSEDVQARFVALGEELVDVFTGISGPIERALSDLADDLSGLAADLAPAFEAGFARLGPSMSGFFGEITGSLRSLGPLIDSSSEAFAELLDVLGPALGGAIERLAASLDELFRSSDPRFFTDTVVWIVDFTASLIDLITWLSNARSGLMDDLAPALAAVAPLFSGLWSGIEEAAAGFARFGSELFSQFIPAFQELSPLFEDFGAGFELAGRVVAGLLDELSPLLSALQPFVEGFVEGFTEARDLIIDFASTLLDQLGPAGDALEDFAEFVTENETAIRTLGVVIGSVVAVLTTYRVIALSVSVANAILTGSFRALSVAIRSIPVIGWIITALGLLVIVIQQLWERSETFRTIVTNVWDAVSGAFSSAWETIQEVFAGFAEGWEDLTGGVDIGATLGAAWDRLSELFAAGWDIISGVFDAFQEGWSNLVSGAQDSGVLTTVWDGIRDGVQTMWDIVGPVFDELIDTWEFLADLVSGERGLSDLGEVIAGWVDTLQGVGEEIAGLLIRQLGRVPDLVISGLTWFGSTFGGWLFDQLMELPGYALEALSSLPGIIATAIGEIPDQLAEFLGVTDGWTQWFIDLGDSAVEALAGVGERIGAWFTGLPERIERALGVTDGWGEWFQELGVAAIEQLREVGENIAEYIQGIPQMVRDRIDDGQAILEWLSELPPRITEFMRDYGPQILRGFAIAIGIVIAGIPALILGLLASLLFVLGVVAWELIQWAGEAFSNMMARAGEAISEGINNLVEWFAGLPERLLAAVSGFGGQLAAWARGAVGRARTALTTGMNSLATWWTTRWTNLTSSVRTIWTTFTTWIGAQAGRIRDAVMAPINNLGSRLVSAFQTTVRNIGIVWNTLRNVIAAPINWVITNAYTNGIKRVWDRIATKFGGNKLPDAPPAIRFRKGGVFPGGGASGVFPGYTPGRDVFSVPMAAFSGGESVLRPEITRAWGARTTLMLNKIARSGGVKAVRRALMMLFGGQNPFTGMAVPAMAGAGGRGYVQRFERGGIIGPAGRAWAWLSSNVEDFAEGMGDFLDDPAGVFRKMVEGLVDFGSIPNASTDWAKMIVKIPRQLLADLAKEIKKLYSIDAAGDWMNIGGSVGGRLGAALAFAKAQAGKPYIWGGVGPRGYDCSGFMSAIHNVILGRRPYSRRYTTHSFVGTSANGFRRNFPSPFTIGNTHANVGHMAGTLLRTNVESRGSVGVVVGPRARGTTNPLFTSRWGLVTGASSRGGRMGGEGILYDSGGWLQPGVWPIANMTRKPESIRTAAQEANVERLVRLVQERIPLRNTAALVPSDRIGEFNRVMRSEGAAVGGTVINAPVHVTTNAADPETVAYKVAGRIARLAGV